MRVDAKKEPQATRMTSSDRQVEDLHSELLSVKSSERKAALKKLLSWLDVGTFLVKLDENTHKLATEKSTPLSPYQASRPAVCHSLCKCIQLEFNSVGKYSRVRFCTRKSVLITVFLCVCVCVCVDLNLGCCCCCFELFLFFVIFQERRSWNWRARVEVKGH